MYPWSCRASAGGGKTIPPRMRSPMIPRIASFFVQRGTGIPSPKVLSSFLRNADPMSADFHQVQAVHRSHPRPLVRRLDRLDPVVAQSLVHPDVDEQVPDLD